jgi:hypothetical protein
VKLQESGFKANAKFGQPNRERVRELNGAVDARLPPVAETARYPVFQVRWPVLEGLWGSGLLCSRRARLWRASLGN